MEQEVTSTFKARYLKIQFEIPNNSVTGGAL
ncbi:hypothetical protein AYI68_g5330, partial [Smittium mucronatum]